MLFKTTEEIKEFLPVVGTTKFERMSVFIKQAERDYIIPRIGQAQYDAVNTAYNAVPPTLTAAQTALLIRCQDALSQYFFFLWIPFIQLSIGDNGIRIATTDTLKTAFQWQIDDLKRSTISAAGSAMDVLLEYMETNKADYALWVASTSYTELKECFITSTKRFTQLFSLLGNSRLNFLAIRSAMLKTQEFIIMAQIGEAYYEELLAQHLAGTVSPDNAKVITRIQKALASLTMHRAIAELCVTIDERGILNFDNTGSQAINLKKPAKDQMITKLELTCEADGKAFLLNLKTFLKANITLYPTYAVSDAYDSETTDTDFKTDSEDTLFNF